MKNFSFLLFCQASGIPGNEPVAASLPDGPALQYVSANAGNTGAHRHNEAKASGNGRHVLLQMFFYVAGILLLLLPISWLLSLTRNTYKKVYEGARLALRYMHGDGGRSTNAGARLYAPYELSIPVPFQPLPATRTWSPDIFRLRTSH
jgi:hypothetical protein